MTARRRTDSGVPEAQWGLTVPVAVAVALLLGFVALPPLVGGQAAASTERLQEQEPATPPEAQVQSEEQAPEPEADVVSQDAFGDPILGENPVEGQRAADEIDLSAPWFQQATLDERRALVLVEQILQEQRAMLSGTQFSYEPEGRRDPFRNLLARTQRTVDTPQDLPRGLGGMLINETFVAAVAQYQGRWYAMLTGSDQRSHIAHVGDEMYDGRLVQIAVDQVVFEQEVYDGMGARSTRTVTKRLSTDSG